MDNTKLATIKKLALQVKSASPDVVLDLLEDIRELAEFNVQLSKKLHLEKWRGRY